MAKNIISKIKRGSLILYALNGITRESFNVIKRELRDSLGNASGIYALYKKDKLVRVGLGTQIYWRVKSHSKNKEILWDNASLFIIRSKNLTYLRDLETAIVRIAKPEGNSQKGRVGNEHYLARLLNEKVKAKKKKIQEKKRRKDTELKSLDFDIKQIERVTKKNRNA